MIIIPEIGYSPTQAARFLGVSTKTVYRAMDADRLKWIPRLHKRGKVILGKDIIKFSKS